MTKPENDEQSADPTSFVIPNPVAFLFPVYWLSVLAYRSFSSFLRPSSSPNHIRIILKDLKYAECPRVRDGHILYFSDMFDHAVYVMDMTTERIVNTISFGDSKPAGLGFVQPPLSSSSQNATEIAGASTSKKVLLVVLMDELKLVTYDEETEQIKDYADVSATSRVRANDMCVDTMGRAYVGNFGFDLNNLYKLRATTLTLVNPPLSSPSQPRTAPIAVAKEMFFPNGTVITPDGKTLIIAETFRGLLTAFDICPVDGTLSRRRTWAYVGLPLDGICLDADGRVWAAVPNIGAVRALGGIVRVREGGHIDCALGFGDGLIDRGVIACNLISKEKEDGSQQHQLIMLCAKSLRDAVIERIGKENSFVAVADVDCGPARIPGNNDYHAGYC